MEMLKALTPAIGARICSLAAYGVLVPESSQHQNSNCGAVAGESWGKLARLRLTNVPPTPIHVRQSSPEE